MKKVIFIEHEGDVVSIKDVTESTPLFLVQPKQSKGVFKLIKEGPGKWVWREASGCREQGFNGVWSSRKDAIESVSDCDLRVIDESDFLKIFK